MISDACHEQGIDNYSPLLPTPVFLLGEFWDRGAWWATVHGVTDSQTRLRDVGFPSSSDSKESACNAGDLGSIPGLGRSPGEGTGYTPVFLPGEFHGQRSLVGCSPQGCKESDTTERLHFHFHFPHSQHHHSSNFQITILQPKILNIALAITYFKEAQRR